MAIGNNDDIDDIDQFDVQDTNPVNNQPAQQQQADKTESDNPDFITTLLQDHGITDKSKIKFEDEGGDIKEVNWDDLSTRDKMNILKTTSYNPSDDISDDEAAMLNSVRKSGLSPTDYLKYVASSAITNYQSAAGTPEYTVDQYTDDELYVADFLTKTQDATPEEAKTALEQAKQNPQIYEKQIKALRKEYQDMEADQLAQEQYADQQAQQQRFNQFANSVATQISNLKDIEGYDLNLNRDDQQELYDFLTTTDAAGNNYFLKALNDPKTLVETAWFALNGRQMIQDITDYFKGVISDVRKQSYKKGKDDALNGRTEMVYKAKPGNGKQVFDDLDDI